MATVDQFDRSVVLFLNQFVGRHAFVDRAASSLVSLHIVSSIPMLACVCYLWFRAKSTTPNAENSQLLREFVGALVVGPLSRCLQVVLKYHPRPFHSLSNFHVPATVDPTEFNHWSSFPSDHAAVYCALAAVIWFHSRRLGIAAWIWAAITVLPRIYLGYHWPSDILAGATLGIALVWLFRRFIPESVITPIRDLEIAKPAIFYSTAFLVCYQLGTLFEDVRKLGKGIVMALIPIFHKR